jgi:hypothetical protein
MKGKYGGPITMNKLYLLKENYANNDDYDDYGYAIIGAFTSVEAINKYVSKKCKFVNEFASFKKEGEAVEVKTNLLPPSCPIGSNNYTFSIEFESVFVIA